MVFFIVGYPMFWKAIIWPFKTLCDAILDLNFFPVDGPLPYKVPGSAAGDCCQLCRITVLTDLQEPAIDSWYSL